MNKRNSQSGGAHLFIIIVLTIALIGLLGFVIWNNFISPKKTVVEKVTPVATVKKETTPISPTNSWKTYANEVIGIASFKYPSDWVAAETYDNNQGAVLKSPDFASEKDYYKINKGSIVSVVVGQTDYSNTDESLTADAMSIANTSDLTDSSFIEVNGQRMIKFSHHAGESRNSQTVVLFFRNFLKYYITQQYKLDSDNPYPDLLNDLVSNIKFNN